MSTLIYIFVILFSFGCGFYCGASSLRSLLIVKMEELDVLLGRMKKIDKAVSRFRTKTRVEEN